MLDKDKKHKCFNCKFYMTQDYGYSNYTVEGTDHHCLKQCNPFMDNAVFTCVRDAEARQKEINSTPFNAHIKNKKKEDVLSPFLRMCEHAEKCLEYKEDKNGQALQFDVDGEITIKDCNDQDIIDAWNKIEAIRILQDGN